LGSGWGVNGGYENEAENEKTVQEKPQTRPSSRIIQQSIQPRGSLTDPVGSPSPAPGPIPIVSSVNFISPSRTFMARHAICRGRASVRREPTLIRRVRIPAPVQGKVRSLAYKSSVTASGISKEIPPRVGHELYMNVYMAGIRKEPKSQFVYITSSVNLSPHGTFSHLFKLNGLG
jgi:hypothetical protein